VIVVFIVFILRRSGGVAIVMVLGKATFGPNFYHPEPLKRKANADNDLKFFMRLGTLAKGPHFSSHFEKRFSN
jgi:hypothetical protein